eukprot:TRINITY_DN33909_c0_g1_i1.p1 TRINITY_DN33909_c0_g1~~TRINITY_DN33909_c0_g1_i1.p1  ORF type:complete len:260 (+),score=55.15 TRINITY_DN33909_c0_g1_i1:37-780(+)
MPGRKRRQIEEDSSTESSGDEVVKIGRRGTLKIKQPVRANAVSAMAKIKKGYEEGKYSESSSDSSDETLSELSDSDETVVKEPAGVSATQMKDDEALQFELSDTDYKAYRARIDAIAKWRTQAEQQAELWKADREKQRMDLLASGEILSGWVMPTSGQPLPQHIRYNNTSDTKSKKPATVFQMSMASWNAHKASNPDLAEELTAHSKSAQAFLPKQAFKNRASEAKEAREEAGYAAHQKMRVSKGLV